MQTRLLASYAKLRQLKPFSRLLCVILAFAAPPLYAATSAELAALSRPLRLDPRSISVSGLSSGAFMAQQLHISHAKRIHGAAVIAGGPYRCAAGTYPGSYWDSSGLYAALNICTHIGPTASLSPAPSVDFSIQETRRLAKAGLIDAPENLADSKVWLFSGANDNTVPTRIMDSVANYYRAWLPAAQLRYIKHPKASHAMITPDQGGACALNQAPYINDCDFDAAGALLQYFYGPLKVKSAAKRAALVRFNQQAFFDAQDASVSMHPSAYVYIPPACQAGTPCRLHIALHGCQQTQAHIGAAFYTQTGYNEWAESNQIVILYPQAMAWTGGFWFGALRNPNGCWDWWGYSGKDYATQNGKQIRAILRMVDTLLKQN